MEGAIFGPDAGDAPQGPAREAARGSRLARLTVRFSALNAAVYAAGLITGPLLAHALGADGRGRLAAVLVPLSLAPTVLSIGLGSFVSRSAARGRPLGPLFGTTAALAAGVGLLGALAGIPLAGFLAEGRDDVHLMLLLGFWLLPLALAGQLLFSVAMGLARYREVAIMRAIPPLIALAGIGALAALGEITVVSASVVTLVGGLCAIVPLLGVLRDCLPLRVRGGVARAATAFGLKTWVGTLSYTANARLDQLLMIKLVSERQLGLYAIAVTFAGFTGIVASSVSGLVMPRAARGDLAIVKRTLRVMMALMGAGCLGLGLVAPLAIPLLFGEAFSDAVQMSWILLVAALPLAAAGHLAPSLISMGHPGVGSIGQLVGLGVTVAGLPLALPALGGVGAALVSLVAYSATAAYLLSFARRRHGGSLRSYLIVDSKDLSWVGARVWRPGRRLTRSA